MLELNAAPLPHLSHVLAHFFLRGFSSNTFTKPHLHLNFVVFLAHSTWCLISHMDAPVRPCSDIDNITDEKARTQDLGSFVAMAVMGDDPFGSFSIRDEKVEAVDLLEVCWFFENLLERRKMMSRCYSDPCTSSDFCQEMMVRNSYANDRSPPEKLPEGDDCVGHTSPSLPCLGRREATQEEGPGSGPSKSTQNHLLGSPSLPPSVERREGEIQVKDVDLVQPNLLRAPSLAPCVGRKEGAVQEGEIGLGTGKLTQKSSQRGLLRAPSMPPCVGREGLIQYKERDPRSSKLTRTTSLSPPDILPRRHTSKVCIFINAFTFSSFKDNTIDSIFTNT